MKKSHQIGIFMNQSDITVQNDFAAALLCKSKSNSKEKAWCSVKEVDEPDFSGTDKTQLMENIAF
jgi:hypothetical protein